MDEKLSFFQKCRHTKGYKFMSYATYIGLVSVILFCVLGEANGFGVGMGALLLIMGVIAILGFFNLIITICFIGAVVAASRRRYQPENVNLIHDIGAVLCLLCYLGWSALIILSPMIDKN